MFLFSKSAGQRQRKNRSNAIRRAAIEPLESRCLLSTTIPIDYALLETKSLNSTSATIREFDTSLVKGDDYFVIISATVQIGVNRTSNTVRYSDAMWHDQKTDSKHFNVYSQVVDLMGVTNIIGVNEQNDHVYGQHVTATSDKLTMKFNDVYYPDNAGALTVKLYHKVALKALTFDNDQGINRDNGNGAYSGAEWFDADASGTIDSSAKPYRNGTIDDQLATTKPEDARHEHQYPVSYVRSTSGKPSTMKVTLQMNGAVHGNWNIKGFGSDGATFGGLNGTPLTGASVTLTSDIPLGDKIASSDYAIRWYSIDENGSSKTIQLMVTTHNHLYVTGTAAANAFETVLDLGCEGAKGKRPRNSDELAEDTNANGTLDPGEDTDGNGTLDDAGGVHDREAANGIFGKFSGLNTKRVDDTRMVYDPSQVGHSASVPLSRKDGHGQCSSWADLLYQTLTAQGVTATKRGIVAYSGPPRFSFRVKDGDVQGGVHLSYPRTAFTFHVVVETTVNPNRIYDASFGVTTDKTTASSVEQQWEDDHVLDFFDKNTSTWVGSNPAGAQLNWFGWTK